MRDKGEALVVRDDCGLYCPQGDFYIDPWKSVERAIITHAHSDHARLGSKSYLTALPGKHVLRARLGAKACIEVLPYAETRLINGVKISFHPAGHVLGSAQIRLEYRGKIWVVSGDYKTRDDATCDGFELVKCHSFISESTFALPIYRWKDPSVIAGQINSWWATNSENGKISLLFAYSLGKAQRLLSMLSTCIGQIFVHSSIEEINKAYALSKIALPAAALLPDLSEASPLLASSLLAGAIVIAPPNSRAAQFLQSLNNCESAFASGWMRVRSQRKRNRFNTGFVLSDHADWDELLKVITATEAEQVIVTHGFSRELRGYLNERGKSVSMLRTDFRGEKSIADGPGSGFVPEDL